MEVSFEMKVEIDGEVVYNRELKVEDSNKEIVKAAILAGLETCGKMCLIEVSKAIEDK